MTRQRSWSVEMQFLIFEYFDTGLGESAGTELADMEGQLSGGLWFPEQ